MKRWTTFLYTFILALVMLAVSCVAIQAVEQGTPEDSVTYIFLKVEKLSDARVDTASYTMYAYDLKVEGTNRRIGSTVSYREFKHLLSIFKVKRPLELVGKSFTVPKQYSSIPLNYLIVLAKHGGKYTPPTEEELYERAAISLAKMKCPNFSDVDKKTTSKAFHKVFDGFSVNKNWLQWLKKYINELSGGKVRLEKTSPEDFKRKVKGPAVYLLLVGEIKGKIKKQKVIFGPYATPFIFEK